MNALVLTGNGSADTARPIKEYMAKTRSMVQPYVKVIKTIAIVIARFSGL